MQDTFTLIYVWKYICQPENPSHFGLDGCAEYISTPDISSALFHIALCPGRAYLQRIPLWVLFFSDLCQELEETGSQKKSMVLVFVSLGPSSDITMACLLPLTIAVVLSGDPFHTALSISLFSLLLLYLALSAEECWWYNTSWFPSTLPIHMALVRLANLYIPSVFFRVPNNAEICIFTHSGWLSKAVVFRESAIGFWPKKSNHIYIIKV